MKLMVSVFLLKGRFCLGRMKKHNTFFWYGLHFIQQEALKTFFSQKMLLRIWRQHPLCFGDVVSRTERCILYDGRPFDLRTYRLETEAGSKLTQLGLMARCRQIRQQQSFAGINLRSYIAPRKHQRNTFFCTTVLFLGVLKQWFHRWSYRAARIEKNALYQHQHGNLQVKNPASPKFCACFFWFSSGKTVKWCKAAPSAKKYNMFLAHFFSKQENTINNHRVTQVFENALLKTLAAI